MNSHEYANKLKELAEFLLCRPEFEVDSKPSLSMWYWQDKEKFLAAVRALGSGKKEYEDGLSGDVLFRPNGIPDQVSFHVRASRSAVCRKVQEEKWECEPLLSQAEEAQIGQ